MDNADTKILIAEDDDLLRSLLMTVVEEEDYQVAAAVNGLEAWQLMQENYRDLLLTDLFMPKMDGIELIRKCQQVHPATKIVLLSGGGPDLVAEHGSQRVVFLDQEVTVDMYLKKPARLTELLSVLDDLL